MNADRSRMGNNYHDNSLGTWGRASTRAEVGVELRGRERLALILPRYSPGYTGDARLSRYFQYPGSFIVYFFLLAASHSL